MRFRIRSKLAAALVVPLVALVVGSGLLAVDARAEADRVDTEIGLSMLALGPGSVTRVVQGERDLVARELLGLGATNAVADGSLADAAAATDAAAAALEGQLRRFDRSVRRAFGPALESLAGLADVRDRHRGHTGSGDVADPALVDELLDAYRTVIERLSTATATVAAGLDDSGLRNGVELSDALNRRSEALTASIHHVATDVASGQRSSGSTVAISAATARARLVQERIEELGVGSYEAAVRDDPAQETFDRAISTVESHIAGRTVDPVDLLDTAEGAASTQADAVAEVLRSRADAVLADARSQVRLYVIAAAVVVSLAILVSYFATTSITRPLRALRSQADDLARTRLPGAVRSVLETPPGEDVTVPEVEPIGIVSGDEVGDVAEALNEVQSSTLTLAADQAVLRRNFTDSFVNLGRRNQLLLDRQLDFITELEQNETDPEQLDALFRLDHLATRMRRNAESLLVLAGAESPRQWGAPVAMTDVVRSGLSEVEDYQRVHIRHLDDARVVGRAVAGLAHVLAELAENAVAFSPPDEQVEVKGRWSGGGDYVIAIADNGIGMTDDELAQANRRLSGRESYTVAPSRYLGHYVAGNLARRLDVSVRLQDDPAGGLVATVTLPPGLMAPAEQVEEPAGPSDGQPAVQPAIEPAVEPAVEPGGPLDGRVVEPPAAEDPVDREPAPTGRPEAAPAVTEPAPPIVQPAESAASPARSVTASHQDAGPPAEPEQPAAPVTGDELPRRVPGAQRPDGSALAARRTSDVPVGPATGDTGTGDTGTGNAGTGDTTTGAFGFLEAFRSGGVVSGPSGNGDAGAHLSDEEER